MLVLTKNSANTIRVSLAELSTLSNPVYLIEFISDTSLISTTCIAPDLSSYPARYNEFTITEQDSPDGLLAQIKLEPVGFFTYNIYEQTSATNLSPNAPGTVLLETGKARVLIDGDRESTAFSYYQNPTQDFHAWDVFNSEGISPAPPSTDATYQNSDASFTQVIAPGVTYTAPDISFTDSDGTVIPTPANTNIVATPSTNDVFLKGLFAATIADMPQLIIDSDNAGTFTSISDDGASGTITLSINGGAYAVFSSPLVLSASDTLDVKRTVSTATGHFKLTGTF